MSTKISQTEGQLLTALSGN